MIAGRVPHSTYAGRDAFECGVYDAVFSLQYGYKHNEGNFEEAWREIRTSYFRSLSLSRQQHKCRDSSQIARKIPRSKKKQKMIKTRIQREKIKEQAA